MIFNILKSLFSRRIIYTVASQTEIKFEKNLCLIDFGLLNKRAIKICIFVYTKQDNICISLLRSFWLFKRWKRLNFRTEQYMENYLIIVFDCQISSESQKSKVYGTVTGRDD